MMMSKLLVVALLLTLGQNVLGDATSCPGGFTTPAGDYDVIVNICTTDTPAADDDQGTITIDPTMKYLLVTPNYGCGNYPSGAYDCQVNFASPDADAVFDVTVVNRDMARSSQCNGNSDRLIIFQLVGGDANNNFRERICGTSANPVDYETIPGNDLLVRFARSNLDLTPTLAGFEILFSQRGGDVLPECTNPTYRAASTDYDSVINICDTVNPGGTIDLGTRTVNPGDRILLVSPNRGCGNYPDGPYSCTVTLQNSDASGDIRSVVYTDFDRGSACNDVADHLYLRKVKGPRGTRNRLFCGETFDQGVLSLADQTKYVFNVDDDGNTDLGFEVLVIVRPIT